MTRGKRFKRLVRARAAETGQSYTGALRRFQPKPQEGDPVKVNANTDIVSCSFCGKSQEEATKLMAGPGVQICEECIRLGYDLVSDEPTPASAGQRPIKPPFARFTERAGAALVEAQQAARELHHNFLGTEHLLLGVLATAQGPLAELLSSKGLDVDSVRGKVTALVGPSSEPLLAAPPFTPRAMRSLELAGEQATLLGQERVDTAHLVLGQLAEGHGLAARLLGSAGITASDAQNIAGTG